MRLRLLVTAALLPAFMALAGCQMLPGAGGGAPAASSGASPITGEAIAVTSLDAPTQGVAEAPVAAAAAPGAAPAANPTAEEIPPAADPASAEAAPPETADPLAAEPVAPAVIKSPSHIACERRGGRWSVAGGGAAAFCQTPTRDGGKSCRASTDCTGYCLEKSRTCAPVTPMLGCHDILNEAGRMLTECIN